jgi:hypothetical protein
MFEQKDARKRLATGAAALGALCFVPVFYAMAWDETAVPGLVVAILKIAGFACMAAAYGLTPRGRIARKTALLDETGKAELRLVYARASWSIAGMVVAIGGMVATSGLRGWIAAGIYRMVVLALLGLLVLSMVVGYRLRLKEARIFRAIEAADPVTSSAAP